MSDVNMYAVKNIKNKDTAEHKPDGYNSWVEYWEANNGKNLKANICSRYECNSTENLDGAHIEIAGIYESDSECTLTDNYKGRWYIVPLCHEDNMSDGTFYIKSGIPMLHVK